MKLTTAALLLLLLATIAVSQGSTAGFRTLVSWSPDSKSLTFTTITESIDAAGKKSYPGAIYVCRADGTDLHRLTTGESKEFASSWSGKTIAFGGGTGGDPATEDVFLVNADTTGSRQLTHDAGRNSAPNISPNGKMIVFTSTRDGGKGMVYVMKSDGTGIKRLTTDPTGTITFYNPIWSPNGKQIVYYTEKGDKKDQIWVMNADGSKQTLLTNNIGHNFYPSWSADGKRILFISTRDGSHALFTMNRDGSDLKHLAAIDTFYGRMSPDGKRVAYIVGEFPHSDIYVANADGSNPVNITGK